MGRLTNSIDYCSTHCDFGKQRECFFKDKSKCYENNIFEKLRAYEDIIDSPEKLKLIDELYLERCEEINRLKAELAEKEEEFCEWKFEETTGIVWHCGNECTTYNLPYAKNLEIILKDFECKCPYCGRKIKEVKV